MLTLTRDSLDNLAMSTLMGVPDLVCLCEDNKIQWINRAGWEMLNCPDEAYPIGKLFTEFLGSDYAALGRDLLPMLAEEKDPLQTKMKDANGVSFDCQLHIIAKFPDNLDRYVILVRNITEFIQTAETLYLRENYLRELINNSLSMICDCRDGKIQFINRAGLKLLGAESDDQVIGRPIENFFHQDYQHIFKEEFKNILFEDQYIPTRLKRIDGTYIDTDTAFTQTDSSKNNYFLAEAHDITQQNRAVRKLWETIENLEALVDERTKKLLDAKEQAETTNQAKSEFLSSMSHELRTPLNAILGFGQMLEYNPNEPLTVDQKDSVNQIMKGGQHLLELINDVLDLAKVEAGKVDLSIEDVSVKSVLDECLALIQTMAEDRGIEIIIGDGFEVDAEIRTDQIRFKQSLLNLMSNAVKYNNENGSVTINCHKTPGAMFHISITDTGNGISEDMYDALFQPFNRLDAENTEIEGTGIGLTITKQLIERMDGHIGVESEVGKGSTFWIELPRVGARLAQTLPSTDGNANEGVKLLPEVDGTILYVEDNPANLKLMEMIISRVKGLSMISVHNAELGIELAKKEKPDMIILDINLPGMNGYEALTKLHNLKETKDTPIIALSANAMHKDIEKGIEAGFKRYLTKPIDVEEVVDVLKDILKR